MTEEELQEKRKDFRDQEVMKKISQYSEASDYRQQVLKTNYTRKIVDKNFGKMGYFLIITQSLSLLFFVTLWIFSYIPQTKKIVAMWMP